MLKWLIVLPLFFFCAHMFLTLQDGQRCKAYDPECFHIGDE
mgnify:CR=1 FL=1